MREVSPNRQDAKTAKPWFKRGSSVSHTAQLILYLKAVESPGGLLINFDVSLLKDGIKLVVRG